MKDPDPQTLELLRAILDMPEEKALEQRMVHHGLANAPIGDVLKKGGAKPLQSPPRDEMLAPDSSISFDGNSYVVSLQEARSAFLQYSPAKVGQALAKALGVSSSDDILQKGTADIFVDAPRRQLLIRPEAVESAKAQSILGLLSDVSSGKTRLSEMVDQMSRVPRPFP